MAHTVFSMNAEEDRKARDMLRRLADDGPEAVHLANASSVKLLERHGMVSSFNGMASLTDKGLAEIGSRVLRKKP